MTDPDTAPVQNVVAGQTSAETPAWERRYRAVRVSLPEWAEDAPHRCLYLSNAGGTYELWAWDRQTGDHRQVTDRRNGTYAGRLDPSGEWIWWFADTDGDEYGVWMRQPFGGGPDEPAVPGLPPSYSAGLALGRAGLAVIGRSAESGTTVHIARPGEDSVTVYAHAEDAGVAALSEDGTLLAITHSEHGDSRHPALRVLWMTDGSTVADLWDGPGKGLEALDFGPRTGDTRLLARHERRGRGELLIWDVVAGGRTELLVALDGELSGQWYRDGTAVLVEREYAGRADLHRYDLRTGALTGLETPPGVVSAATARPDGAVEFSWSSAAAAPVIRSTAGSVVLVPPGEPPPPSVPVQDVRAAGPGGQIHALLSRPAGVAPYPAVFLLHGGPAWHDSDSFAADVAAWVDQGFAVVRVNYRGSTGYGSAWRDAIEDRIGHTELADVAAVRDRLVADGVVSADRLVLAGGSWGGYLTLLGLGVQPERWTVGVAGVPVADYVTAYEDESPELKAFDRSLFGGSPTEVAERYADASPITYVDAVRAPVLVLAGANDPCCPIRQVENYLARLRAPHEVYRFDAGHGSLVVDERIRQQRAEMDFVRRHLPPRR